MKNDRSETFSSFTLGTLWFGAAISVAELLTGAMLAPLGFGTGLAVVLFGHVVGGLIFFGAGWISTKTRETALGASRLSFGTAGPAVFGFFNVLQLVGWTAVMVILGSNSLDAIAQALWHHSSPWLWKIVLGGVLLIWTATGLEGIKKLNTAAVILVCGLTVFLAWAVAHGHPDTNAPAPDPINVSNAIELVVVMPLSWLPLVGDYTRRARSAIRGNLTAVIGYVVASVGMYSIGLAAALVLKAADPTQQIISAGLGIAGLAIITLSTATSGFLDVVSSGVSFTNVIKRPGERTSALILGTVGILLALILPLDQYQNFLYAIGAIFAPLYAVLLADYLLLKKPNERRRTFYILSFIAWAWGVGLYYLLQNIGTPVGVTVPTFLITAVISLVLKKIFLTKIVVETGVSR